MTEFKFKKDKYRRNRGGYSRFLNVYCSNCGEHLFLYQKDGPGILKRAYLDRIVAPETIADYVNLDAKKVPNLICDNCGQKIGSFYIYPKEERKAMLLNQGSFSKKITKGFYPPIQTQK